ncbi:MAG: SDR family oxidoreductase [Candidatus Promineifilaceae bacterium]|jgi:all-trans-retinol dehydrogenase (NAD+)
MSEIAGQNVLITGAGSGIGRLLADRVVERGGFVIAWDINQDALAELAAAYPDQVASYQVDLASKEDTQIAAQRVVLDYGRVDILVNNAGIVDGKSILDCDDEEIQRTFEVNILAHFWTVRAFLPGMIERGHGHIVTVSSAAAISPAPRLADYAASKWAAFGFDEALRLEFKRDNLPIKTTVVCPYYINTGMFEGVKTRFNFLLPILQPEDVADKMIRAIEKDHPRLVMPPFVYLAYPMRLLPVSLFDLICSFFGISRSMDDFIGRDPHS